MDSSALGFSATLGISPTTSANSGSPNHTLRMTVEPYQTLGSVEAMRKTSTRFAIPEFSVVLTSCLQLTISDCREMQSFLHGCLEGIFDRKKDCSLLYKLNRLDRKTSRS